MDLEKINSIKTNPTSLNEVSNKITKKDSNSINFKAKYSKDSINFETQSSSDHISRNYSKYDKSLISVQKIEIENDNLNQTSHFLNNSNGNNDNLIGNDNSNINNYIIYDKFSFKNNSFKNNENNNFEFDDKPKNLKSLYLTEGNKKSNCEYHENKNDINKKKSNKLNIPDNQYKLKSNFSFNNFINNNSINSNSIINNSINNNSINYTNSINNSNNETFKNNNSNMEFIPKKNILNSFTIPMFTKKLLFKNFNEYLLKNKPTVYDNKLENSNIFGFSALTFKNSSPKCRTKISINININTEYGIFHFFDLHSILIKRDILNSKFDYLSNDNNIINKKFFSNIYGHLLIIKIHNDQIFIISNKENTTNKLFYYRGIFSSNTGKTILSLNNNIQNIPKINDLDFIILFNIGIFHVLSNKEIIIIIYKTLIENIINKSSFGQFLEDIVKNIFNAVINYGGNIDMSCLFICFENMKNLFFMKSLDKIIEIFDSIEKGFFEDDDIEKIPDSFSPQKSIKIKNYNNLTFKEAKSNFSEDTTRLITHNVNNNNNNIKKKKKFFSCCGLFN